MVLLSSKSVHTIIRERYNPTELSARRRPDDVRERLDAFLSVVMAVTPKANLKPASFFSTGGPSRPQYRGKYKHVLILTFASIVVLLCALKATGNAKILKVRIRVGSPTAKKKIKETSLLKEKRSSREGLVQVRGAHGVLDEVKHSFDHVFHTTFGEDEEEEGTGEESGEHTAETVIAHDLPQSTMEAHLETEEERRSSDDKSNSNGAESNALQHQSSNPAGATSTTATAKPHLARGWLVSKLPFDVDQPGSERTALEANFNGSVPMLTYRGLFKYDPTPRADGMNYYRRVYAVTQVGMAEDLPNWKSIGEVDMEATANSRKRRRLLRHRNSGGREGAANADGEALAAEAETVIDESDDVGLGVGSSGVGSDSSTSDDVQQQQQQQQQQMKNEIETALRSKPPGTRGLTFRITKNLYDALPPRDPSWRYKTCAVVGNGGALLTTRHGKDIDAHDAVLRMNNAPVGGRFTDFVGSKTTFNMINFHWAREITQKVPVVETDAFLVMYESVLHTLRNQLYPRLLRMQAQGQLPVIPVLTSPDFTVKGYGIWLQLKDVLEQRRAAERREKNAKLIKEGKAVEQLKHPGAYKRKPMSGFFAMLFMLNLCDSVDMYGFSNWRPSRSKIPYHYFDKVKGTTAVHSFDLSMEVFMEIAKAHDVNMIDSEGKSTKLK